MKLHWWKTGVIYQIYPRSFQDSDADGIGDLAGIIRRLDHLMTLGIDAVWLSPIFPSPMADFGYVNAAQQRRDPNSMLNWTERIVRMRKEVPEIGWGDFEILNTRDPAVLAIRYDWRDNSALFVHNFSATPRETAFAVGLAHGTGRVLINLLSDDHSQAGPAGRNQFLLEAYGYRWFRVGGRDARV